MSRGQGPTGGNVACRGKGAAELWGAGRGDAGPTTADPSVPGAPLPCGADKAETQSPGSSRPRILLPDTASSPAPHPPPGPGGAG